MIQITPALLEAAVGCTPERAEKFAGAMQETCSRYGINATVPRLAAFLAQVGHESASFRYTREIASGEAYEGRASLGNTQPGDGKRFRGRGLIQLTGRSNYQEMSRFLGMDFVAEPEKLEELPWSVLSAGAYWNSRGLNAFADAGAFDAITRKINGGTNGKVDRDARYARALAALQAAPEPVKEPEVVAPVVVAATPFIVQAAKAMIERIPDLLALFKGRSDAADKNIELATRLVEIGKEAVGAVNEQELVEKLTTPDGAAAVQAAVKEHWFEVTEAGGGGIAGARAADMEFARNIESVWKSPSFWVAAMLLPLVYIVMGNVVGLYGLELPGDVRAAVINGVVGMVLGGVIGYYFGQTTSRNRK